MKILFLMDPFVDLDWEPKRTFVLNHDLNLTRIAFAKESKDKIAFLGLKSLINEAKIRNHLIKNNVMIHEVDDDKLLEQIKICNTNLISIITNKIEEKEKSNIIAYLKSIISTLDFDLVIYWEFISEIFFEIFKDSKFLEGSHSGLYRLENNADVIYIEKKKSFYDYSFVNVVNYHSISSQDISHISDISDFVKETILFETNITRNFIDPEQKFKKILFYPIHFESNRFIADTGFASQIGFLNFIIDSLPIDYGIVVTKHPLNKKIFFNNDRIIDLSEYAETDPNLSLRLIKISDGLINVYSSIFIFASLLHKPIFTYGRDLYAKFSSAKIEDIEKYFTDDDFRTNVDKRFTELSLKLINYIFTHKVDISFFQYKSTSTMYFRRIVTRQENGQVTIPFYRTVEGYYHHLIESYLLSEKISNSYKENIAITELYRYIFIPSIKNVGFDIFDTLLQRPFWNPSQLFDIIEPEANIIVGTDTFGFSNTRILSEEYARKNNTEVTIDKIYEAMGELTGLDESILKRLKSLELSTEKKFIKPRYFFKNIFDLMKIYGKKVFIASDMYLSKEFIVDLLVEHGFDLSNVNVYVSSELNKVKHDGSLFKEILKTEKFIPCQTLFIGDNKKSDIQIPSKLGINTFHAPKAMDKYLETIQFKISEFKQLYECNWALHIPLIANIVFDNPFIEYDFKSYTNNSSKLLGFSMFGPLIASLTFWLIENIKNKEFNQILFAARDSKIVFEVYNKINRLIFGGSLPKSYYVAMSRTSLLPCYNQKISRVNLVNLYVSNLNALTFLKKFFNIDVIHDKIAKRIAAKVHINIYDFAKFQKDLIVIFLDRYYDCIHNISIADENLKKYFNSFVLGKTALFDLGARATSKDALEKILNSEIHCFLFRSTKYKYCDRRIFSYMKDSLNTYRTGIKKILPSFYETILSDNLTNTCEGYDYDQKLNQSVPLVTPKRNLNTSDILILEVQSSIKLFIDLYLNTFGPYCKNINLDSTDVFILPISKLSSGFVERQLLTQFFHDDPLGKDGSFPIIPPLLKKEASSPNSPEQILSTDKLNTNSSLNSNKRDLFIFYKRKFYKYKLGKLVWDYGRRIYLKFLN